MHVIVSSRASHRWLSGIFLRAEDAETSCLALQTDAGVSHAVRAVQPKQFPFFILEDDSGFTFLDPAEAARFIADAPAAVANAEPILFAIVDEYRPGIAGRDEMGSLRHVHLDERHLADLREFGPLSIIT